MFRVPRPKCRISLQADSRPSHIIRISVHFWSHFLEVIETVHLRYVLMRVVEGIANQFEATGQSQNIATSGSTNVMNPSVPNACLLVNFFQALVRLLI